MTQVNIHTAKTELSKLIQMVLDGEDVVIAKNNNPIVKLTLVDELQPKRKLGTAKDQITIAEDFDLLPEDFKEYLD